MSDQMNRPVIVDAPARTCDELRQLERTPADGRRRGHLGHVRLDVLARASEPPDQLPPQMNEVVVRREPCEPEHARGEVDAVEHGPARSNVGRARGQRPPTPTATPTSTAPNSPGGARVVRCTMMRVLIATTGSDGDVRPFLALARELRGRGHDVLFAAPDRYAQSAVEHDVAFRSIGPPWDAEELSRTLARVLAKSNPLAQLAIILESLAEPQRRMVPELLAMVPEHDVVVYQPILVAAPAAARARKVPHVSLQLTPLHRARSYSPVGGDLGPRLNGALWSLARRMLRGATDATLNTIVEAAGLPAWRDVLAEASSSPLLDIVAVSPRIIQRDPAWPASSHVTGYLFLDDADFVPDPELATFVEGERPVVVGFGSMHGFDAEARTRTILDAVGDLPRKVVLLAGWAGLGRADLPAHVHLARFVPHSWLLPRAACVVHHGGAGTTAAAFRAGIPQTFVWHFGDQPSWARLAKARGVSAGSVLHTKLRARWLRERIDRMLAGEGLQDAARRLGEGIREENGAASAADLIERAVSAQSARARVN